LGLQVKAIAGSESPTKCFGMIGTDVPSKRKIDRDGPNSFDVIVM
jgi:hypothetical protein